MRCSLPLRGLGLQVGLGSVISVAGGLQVMPASRARISTVLPSG
jgi:hypothetical protein